MSWVLARPGSVSRARRPTRRAGHHRVRGALALVALWATAAAELSVCSDPSDRMMIVWIFFGSEECDAGNDGGARWCRRRNSGRRSGSRKRNRNGGPKGARVRGRRLLIVGWPA